MTKDELLAKFDPANASNLTESDLEQMRALTDEQIDHLANAYPNQPQRKAYLVLYDKNVDAKKQLYNLSTWQNLRNVRKFANRKNLVPWSFRSLYDATARPQTSAAQQRNTAPARKVTVDLSAEAAAAELSAALAKRPVTSESPKKEAMATAAVTAAPAKTTKAAPAKTNKATAAKKNATTGKQAENTGAQQATDGPQDQEFSSGTDEVE